MMRLLPIVAAVFLLAGCAVAAPAPDRQVVVDRFLTELGDATDGLVQADDPEAIKLAEQIAEDALDGNCGSRGYWTGLGLGEQSSLVRAWAATCVVHFDADMTPGLRSDARDVLLRQLEDHIANG